MNQVKADIFNRHSQVSKIIDESENRSQQAKPHQTGEEDWARKAF